MGKRDENASGSCKFDGNPLSGRHGSLRSPSGIVDLSGMKKIHSINRQHRMVVIEPA
jgi:hypothetical protein